MLINIKIIKVAFLDFKAELKDLKKIASLLDPL